MDPKIEERQKKRLKELKNKRNKEKVKKALNDIKKAIHKQKNLMPVILEAVGVYATVGEICEVMRQEFGEYRESVSI